MRRFALLALVLLACSSPTESEPADTFCPAGQDYPCTCDNGARGTLYCLADGSAYGPCGECESATSGPSTSSSSAASTSGGPETCVPDPLPTGEAGDCTVYKGNCGDGGQCGLPAHMYNCIDAKPPPVEGCVVGNNENGYSPVEMEQVYCCAEYSCVRYASFDSACTTPERPAGWACSMDDHTGLPTNCEESVVANYWCCP